jgi:hypothetical protein
VAAAAGRSEEAVTLFDRAVERGDPFTMISLGTFPPTQRLRDALDQHGSLERIRSQIGLTEEVLRGAR